MERGLKIPQSERTKTTNALLVSLMNQLEKVCHSIVALLSFGWKFYRFPGFARWKSILFNIFADPMYCILSRFKVR